MQNKIVEEADLGHQKVILETGRIAKQANGAVVARIGDTMVLATVCAEKKPREDIDFLPLSVEYREKAYAAGKIPGGFFKRESRPSEKEILSARIIDRPIRPLFPEGYNHEVQIICTIISSDSENDADIVALNAASAALIISDIPFNQAVAGIRIALVNDEYIVNPTFAQMEMSKADIIVAGTKENIIMVEGGACECSEEEMHKAIMAGHQAIKNIIPAIEALGEKAGKPKIEFTPAVKDKNLEDKVAARIKDQIEVINSIKEKKKRYDEMDKLVTAVCEEFADEFPDKENEIKKTIHDLEAADMRKMILEKGIRIDGRTSGEIRPITCEAGLLPRTHGSSLFTRGETQALVAVTLGTRLDEQKVDGLQGESYKNYMLHYNFPPFCVGEVKRLGSTSRREVGHGHLAERSLAPILPVVEEFPYTIRIVSDITESNGSSSMATVCGGSLSLMDAGVPIKTGVAGIAMGLIKEQDKVVILSDILGTEDHLGDMDFKVTGTRQGITGLQMDIKIGGITSEILQKALEQARAGRLHIIEIMDKTISKPRENLSEYAPRLLFVKVPVDKIGAIIGPGGKNIRSLQEETGTNISIEDDGSITISSVGTGDAKAAQNKILSMIEEPELNKNYKATIKNIQSFGAFAEFLPGKEGLIHISELTGKRVNRVEDVLSLGDIVDVKLIGLERDGKCRLSMAAAQRELEKTGSGN
ncbi:MAG: polyribonucleotide nucleotidyltransferase [bacterium]